MWSELDLLTAVFSHILNAEILTKTMLLFFRETKLVLNSFPTFSIVLSSQIIGSILHSAFSEILCLCLPLWPPQKTLMSVENIGLAAVTVTIAVYIVAWRDYSIACECCSTCQHLAQFTIECRNYMCLETVALDNCIYIKHFLFLFTCYIFACCMAWLLVLLSLHYFLFIAGCKCGFSTK